MNTSWNSAVKIKYTYINISLLYRHNSKYVSDKKACLLFDNTEGKIHFEVQTFWWKKSVLFQTAKFFGKLFNLT